MQAQGWDWDSMSKAARESIRPTCFARSVAERFRVIACIDSADFLHNHRYSQDFSLKPNISTRPHKAVYYIGCLKWSCLPSPLTNPPEAVAPRSSLNGLQQSLSLLRGHPSVGPKTD